MMKAAPPFSPTRYGNLQRFPRPTAEPAIATKAPKRLPKLSLVIKRFILRGALCAVIQYLTGLPLLYFGHP